MCRGFRRVSRRRFSYRCSAPFLAYAWTGGAATLNGVPLPLHDGLIEGAAAGAYTLVVDGQVVASATVAANAPVSLEAGDAPP